MRIFLAFSTGVMMGRILAKLLKRKDVNLSDRSELEKVSQKNKEELQKAQELVKEGGVFEKFISDTMLNGVDNSYKTQFINWLWVALADSNEVFDKYIKSFDENGIKSDSHEVTDFIDRVNDFGVHAKKHAEFKQECREILSKISSKQDHISIDDFAHKMIVMNENWNAKKKYIVNDETIDEAWKNIEKNEIHVDGDLGDFHAYKIPSWIDLMQTCHQTNWCVAQKGSNGERYYNHYGEPYYLICDRRREPFALLNPPSKQFKDVKDSPITIRENGAALPSHRKVILFGKALLDKVSPNSKNDGYSDFSCFSKVDEIKKLEEEDRNDRTDYDKLVDQMEDEQFGESVHNAFLDMIRKEDSGYSEESYYTYCNMTDAEKNNVIDDILVAPRTQGIKRYMVFDLIARKDGDRIVKLMDKNTKVYGYRRGNETVTDFMMDAAIHEINRYANNRNTFDGMKAIGDILTRLFAVADAEQKTTIAMFALSTNGVPKQIVDHAIKEVEMDKLDANGVSFIVRGIEKGILDKSIFNQIEKYIIDHGEKVINNETYGRHDLDKMMMSVIDSPLCSERLKKYIYEGMKDNTNWRWILNYQPSHPVTECIKKSEGELVDGIISEMENNGLSREILENSGKKYIYSAAVMNPRCPKELVDRILEIVDYGNGYKIAKGETNGIYRALLEGGKMDESQFMKMLKANPKIIVKWGWDNPYCTDVVKLALAKKIGKQNGNIFHFGKNENPLVMNEFFKSRLSAGRYSEYYEGVASDVIPDEVLRLGLMKITDSTSTGRQAMARTCNSNRLSKESMEYAIEHRDECKWFEGVIKGLMEREDVPDDVVRLVLHSISPESPDETLIYGIRKYLSHHNRAESRNIVKEIADACFGDDSDMPDEYKNIIADYVIGNKNCPDKYIEREYEVRRKEDLFVIEHAIRSGMFKSDKICNDISEINNDYYIDFTGIMKAILESSHYASEDKTKMMLKLEFDKISIALLEEVATQISGKSMFKKIALSLNHNYDSRGRALAENENYTREQIAQIINRNYGVTEGYYNRFGVDDEVIRSKHLYKLIDNHYSDFTKEDRKRILHCDNEDAVWLMKKYIRQEQNIKRGVVNASRMNSMAMKIAMMAKMEMLASFVCDATD